VAGLTVGLIDPGAESERIGTAGYVLLGLAYFVGYFIVIYFQVALVCSIQHRMAGGDPTVGYGIAQANRRLGAIFTWALIAATVGLILRALEQAARGRGAIIGQIMVSVLGFAWNLMVFFVIPVIASEGVSGIQAIKRSSSLMKRRWGEAIIGTQGIGLIVMLATMVLVAIPAFLGFMLINSSVVLGFTLLVIAGGLGVVMTATGSALESTYRAVLYAYAETGDPHGFSKDALDSAFRPKQDIRSSGF
jgi:hypothetical protein